MLIPGIPAWLKGLNLLPTALTMGSSAAEGVTHALDSIGSSDDDGVVRTPLSPAHQQHARAASRISNSSDGGGSGSDVAAPRSTLPSGAQAHNIDSPVQASARAYLGLPGYGILQSNREVKRGLIRAGSQPEAQEAPGTSSQEMKGAGSFAGNVAERMHGVEAEDGVGTSASDEEPPIGQMLQLSPFSAFQHPVPPPAPALNPLQKRRRRRCSDPVPLIGPPWGRQLPDACQPPISSGGSQPEGGAGTEPDSEAEGLRFREGVTQENAERERGRLVIQRAREAKAVSREVSRLFPFSTDKCAPSSSLARRSTAESEPNVSFTILCCRPQANEKVTVNSQILGCGRRVVSESRQSLSTMLNSGVK